MGSKKTLRYAHVPSGSVPYVYDGVTYVYDDVTYVYDDVTYAHVSSGSVKRDLHRRKIDLFIYQKRPSMTVLPEVCARARKRPEDLAKETYS
jgi:hypothetical protein